MNQHILPLVTSWAPPVAPSALFCSPAGQTCASPAHPSCVWGRNKQMVGFDFSISHIDLSNTTWHRLTFFFVSGHPPKVKMSGCPFGEIITGLIIALWCSWDVFQLRKSKATENRIALMFSICLSSYQTLCWCWQSLVYSSSPELQQAVSGQSSQLPNNKHSPIH